MSSSQQLLLGEGAGGSAPVYIEDVFSCFLYTGTGAALTITNNIDLSTKGGLVWIKNRTLAADHSLADTVRGYDKNLASNTAAAQITEARLSGFTSSGFSLTGGYSEVGGAYPYVSWTFRKQPKFFDVVTWTGDDVVGREIPHNLGSVPGCMLVKRLSNGSWNWVVYHRSLGNTKYLVLNDNAFAGTQTYWNNTTPTSTVFTVGDWNNVNRSPETYVAYLFAHDAGGFGLTGADNVVSCSSYTGNGSATGPVINLGYEPQFVIIKHSSGNNDWEMYDNMRGVATGGNDARLKPNSSATEEATSNILSFTSTGFQITNAFSNTNGSGETYIYIAIRRGPMKVPTVGTTVFNPYTATLSSGTIVNVGLAPDLTIGKYRGGADVPRWVDRLRGFARATGGTMPELRSDRTDAEVSSTAWTFDWTNTGFTIGNALNGLNTIIYSMVRAPSFFDEVCYTGTNSGGLSQTISHNLGVAPELTIFKKRSAASNWTVAMPAIGGNAVSLNLNDVGANSNIQFVSTYGASSITTASGYDTISENTSTYVAYLFATCAGVSKVGSYTGTGATQTINCGFTTGARFVMVKRIDSTGNWLYWDTARGMVSGTDPYLLMNSNVGETNTNSIYTESTGFQIVSTAAEINASSGTYIFLAIA